MSAKKTRAKESGKTGFYDRLKKVNDTSRLISCAKNLEAMARAARFKARLIKMVNSPQLTTSELRYCKLEGIKPSDFAARKVAAK
jgi:hypothetical protein